MRRHLDGLTIGCAALLLLAPALDGLLGLDPLPARREMRALATWDAVRAARPTELPGALRDFAGDHFGFRNALIRLYARAMVDGLGVTSSDRVMLGRGGWLYLGTPEAVASARALRPLQPEGLRKVARTFLVRQRALEQQGIRYLLAIVPDKHTVHPEHLPAGITPVGRRTRLEQLERVLSRALGPSFVALRRPLIDFARQGERRGYDRLGTHWSACAALRAHGLLMEPVRGWFPEASVRGPADYATGPAPGGDTDLVRLLGLEGLRRGETCSASPRFAPRARQTTSGRPFAEDPMGPGRIWGSRAAGLPGPRVLVVQDSFGNALRPFLAESFPEVTFFVSPDVVRAADADPLVARMRPDLVLHVFAERRLEQVVPGDPGVQAAATPPAPSGSP